MYFAEFVRSNSWCSKNRIFTIAPEFFFEIISVFAQKMMLLNFWKKITENLIFPQFRSYFLEKIFLKSFLVRSKKEKEDKIFFFFGEKRFWKKNLFSFFRKKNLKKDSFSFLAKKDFEKRIKILFSQKRISKKNLFSKSFFALARKELPRKESLADPWRWTTHGPWVTVFCGHMTFSIST